MRMIKKINSKLLAAISVLLVAAMSMICIATSLCMGWFSSKADEQILQRSLQSLGGAGFGNWSQVTVELNGDGVENADTLFVRASVESEKAPLVYNVEYVDVMRADAAAEGGYTAIADPDGMLFQGRYVGFRWDAGISFQNGDRIVLKEGLRGYKWTGAVYGAEYGAPNALPTGEGEFVPLCELNETVTFDYVDGAWVRYNQTAQKPVSEMGGAGFGNWSQVTVLFDAEGVENAATLFVRASIESEKAPLVYNLNYLEVLRADATAEGGYTALTAPDGMLFQGPYVGLRWDAGISFQNGDRIVLKEGLRGYKWTGAVYGAEYGAPNALPTGAGEFVPLCELNETVAFDYVDGAWVRYSEKVELQLPIAEVGGAGFGGWSQLTAKFTSDEVENAATLFVRASIESEKTPILYNLNYVQVLRPDATAEAGFTVLTAPDGMLFQGPYIGLRWDAGIAFQTGDRIVLKAGLRGYKWTGSVYGAEYGAPNALPAGEGEFVPLCELKEDTTICFEEGTGFIVLHNSIEVTNASDFVGINTGVSKQIQTSGTPIAANTGYVYSSDNEAVATVDGEGNVTGVTAGTCTITVKDKYAATVSTTVNVAVVAAELEKIGLNANVTNNYGKLIAYVGQDLTVEYVAANVSARYVLEGEVDGAALAITAETLDLSNYDKEQVGVQTITVKGEGTLSDTVEVEVFAKVSAEATLPMVDLAWQLLKFTVGEEAYNPAGSRNNILLGNWKEDTIVYYKGGFASTPRAITQIMILEDNIVFLFFADNQNTKFDIGDVLLIKAGFQTKRYTGTMGGYANLEPLEGGEFVVTGEVSKDAKYIYNGEGWVLWNDETNALATEIVCEDFSLPLGASKVVDYTLSPAGAMGKVTLTEVNGNGEALVEGNKLEFGDGYVRGISEGETTLRLRIGDVYKDVTVTVTAAALPESLVLDNAFDCYYVLKDGTFDVTKLNVRIVYEGGFVSDPFTLTAENTKFELDTTALGEKSVELTVSYDGANEMPLTIKVNVYQPRDMKVDSAAPTDWFANMFLIFATTSSTNTSSIMDTEGLENVLDKMEYKRGEEVIEISGFWMLDAAVVLHFADPDFDYQDGDVFRLLPGFTLYSFTGERETTADAANVPIRGTGEFIIESILRHEYVFTNNAGNWQLNLEYEGLEAISENITVGLGKTADVGAIKIPDNATTGSFTYTVADSEIARVSSSGIVTGLKIGKTTVTVTLSGGAAGDKQLVINVEVVDVIKSLKINKTELYIKTGEIVDATWLAAQGVEAIYVYASGKEEKVALTGVNVSGFTPDVDGTYTVTLTLRQGAAMYSTRLTVIANKEGKAPSEGCFSAIVGSDALLLTSVLTIALGAVAFKKRGEEN